MGGQGSKTKKKQQSPSSSPPVQPPPAKQDPPRQQQQQPVQKPAFYVDKGQSADFPVCGISVDYLIDLVKKNKIDGEWNISELVDKFVKPLTSQKKTSFIAYMCEDTELAEYVKPKADFFLSYAWTYEIGTVLSALKKKRKGLFMWMDCFVVNQHESGVKDLDTWLHTFGSAVQSIGLIVPILAPWHAPIPCQRSWCTFELYIAAKYNIPTDCALTAEDEKELMNILGNGTLEFNQLQTIFSNIDVERAKAFKSADREAILGLIHAESDPVKVNDVVSQTIKKWLIDITLKCLSKIEQRAAVADGDSLEDEESGDEQIVSSGNVFQDLADCQNQVSRIYGFLGDVSAQLKFQKLAFENMKKTDISKFELAILTSNLGLAYKISGDYSESEKLYRESLKLHEESMTEEGAQQTVSNDYLQTKNNLAVLLMTNHQYSEANEIEQWVLGTYRQAGPDFKVQVAQCLSSTGLCAMELGNLEQARKDFKEALDIVEAEFGEDNLEITSYQSLFARALLRGSDPLEFRHALEMGEKSYKINRRILKEEHFMTGQSLLIQGMSFWRLGDKDKARELAERGIGLAVSQLGREAKSVQELQAEWDKFQRDFP